jgi:O-antigen/teichoic acid export membrane protein
MISRIRAALQGRSGELVGDSLIYLIGAALVGLGNFILLPLYTRCLTAQQFGLYALLDITVLIVVTITQLGFSISYLKWFADLDRSRHGTLLGSVALITVATGIVGGGLMLAFTRGSNWSAGAGWPIPWLLLVIVPIEGLQGILLTDLRACRRSVWFCAGAAMRLLIMAGASVWFVKVQQQGIPGVFLGRAIGGAAGIVMLAALSLPSAKLRLDWSMIRPMLRYGAPLVWSALVGVGMDASGRFLLARYAGLDQVAIYMVALKIAAVMQVVFLQPFGTAWTSIMFQIGRDKSSAATITRILSHAFVVGMTIAAAISVVSPVVLPLFGNPIYRRAATLIPWLLLPAAFRVLEYWSSLGLYVGNRTGWIAGISTAGAVLNAAAILLLVPRFGAFGAALAWVIALIAMICGNVGFSRRTYSLPYNWGALALGLGLWLAGALTAVLIPTALTPWSVSLALAASILITAPAISYAAKRLLSAQGVAV